MIVQPPRERPTSEAAGYLGYYTRTHVDLQFDLVDVDGAVPVVWWYRKAETQTLRLIEEKPGNQSLHDSQHRLFRDLVQRVTGLSVYVIHEAHRLVQPEFPIRVVRIAASQRDDRVELLERPRFDRWLLEGLQAPPIRVRTVTPCDTWARLNALCSAPFAEPDDLPDGVSWQGIDEALKQLAMAMVPF